MIEYENLGKSNALFFEKYLKSFEDTLNSGSYVLGDNVTKFEQDFSQFINVRNGIGVANGLDALIIALKALNLEVGDEVIVPSNTYIASIIAIIRAGLIPILVEPDIETYNIDPNKIEQSITKRCKAIMVVHLYGKACDMDPILEICNKYKLKLIEDCAQSHGAMYKGKKTGCFGDFGCFSFYPTKNLGALGDAGAIVCNDEKLSSRVKLLRNYGSLKKNYNEVIGYNSRLDEIQAGFLNIKLSALDDITEHKRMLAKTYLNNLDDRFVKPVINEDYFDVYHIFNIRHHKRDKLKSYLFDKGIQTLIHYPIPPHQQKALISACGTNYPISEEIHKTTLSLPISLFHNQGDVEKICKTINLFSE